MPCSSQAHCNNDPTDQGIDARALQVGYDCALVLFFDCPEDVLEARLLGRNQVLPNLAIA